MTVESARTELARAAAELRKEEVVEYLRTCPGLAYQSLTGDRLGPFLVAYNGQVIGKVTTTIPGAVKGWWAHPIGEDTQYGPFGTARVAAAALRDAANS